MSRTNLENFLIEVMRKWGMIEAEDGAGGILFH